MTSNDATVPNGHYDLAGTGWTFRDCRHRSGEGLAEEVSRDGASPAGWTPATVPGIATQDLLSSGRIPDPYFADQASAARFVEERDFVYLRRFILRAADLLDRPRARLVFDSLDTFATVFLNGAQIARHENQFRRLVVDVTEHLREGDNWLAVAFEASWPATVRRAGPERPHWNPPGERLYVRKSQMSFGWDWAVRVPTVGICGPVALELSRGVFADDLWLSGEPVGEAGGSIIARAEYTPHETFDAELALLIGGEERLREHISFHAGHTQHLTLSATLPRAVRWQPRERGVPHLYEAELRVTRQGQIIHRLRGRVGIRSAELDLGTEDERRFRLVINGEPLFVKGENWIPPDLLHTRPSDPELRAYLEFLARSGVNLVRVWGGGIIERRAFYEACDELGLLVWHDFPYACGVYPNEPAFLDEARLEAEDIVKRLRSHTSLVLWCGNNENEVLAEQRLPELRRHPLHYEILPEVTGRLDPQRAYWPGSPASVSEDEPADSPRQGDRHNWDAWNGWQDSDFIADEALFCSEFGYQALPQRESLETFIPHDELWSAGSLSGAHGPSPGLLLARHGAQLDKLLARSSQYAYPRDLDAFIAGSQALQADLLGRLVRHYRGLDAGGVIVWNYTSAWPSCCWALVDWYKRPKQAFYAVQRAFRPLTLSIEPTTPQKAEFVVSVSLDRSGTVEGHVELSLRHLPTGASVLQVGQEVQLHGPKAQKVVGLVVPADYDRKSHALVATLTYATSAMAYPTREADFGGQAAHGELREVRYLTLPRVLERRHPKLVRTESAPDGPTPEPSSTLSAVWSSDTVRLVSSAWHLRVGLESYEAPVLWDDNYVDLLPGEERVLSLVYGQPEHLWLVANFNERVRLHRNQPASL